MKFMELFPGVSMALTNEENQLFEKIKQSVFLPKKKLDKRERQLAFEMCKRGILNRITHDDHLVYVINGLKELHRK